MLIKPCSRLLAYASIVIGCYSPTFTWAGATLDGSTGVGTTGQTFSGDMNIPDSVGTTEGTNLFHSFSDFSINTGESATFFGPDSIINVITRVTGSDPSTFNGALTALIDPSSGQTGANFYFINPNGLIFKEGANLNIGGAFTATTSDFVRLGTDGIYYADLGMTSTMTSSPPSAFGFLDSNPGKISFEGTQLVKYINLNPATPVFSFIAGDISLDEAPDGTATNFGTATSRGTFLTGNRIELVSVASAGEVTSTDGVYDLSSFAALGKIDIINGSVIDATETYIKGGQIVIKDSVIAPGFFWVADMAPPPFSPNGGSITIEGSESVDFIGSGGPLAIAVDHPDPSVDPIIVTRYDGGPLFTGISTFAGDPFLNSGPLDVPEVLIQGGNVSLTGSAGIISQRFGPGAAGDIVINADMLEIRNGSLIINLNTYAGAGGDITVNANQVIIDNEGNSTPFTGLTGISSSSNFSPVYGEPTLDPTFDGSGPPDISIVYAPDLASADAGNITVNATGPGGLVVLGGDISSESRGYGNSGSIAVNASDIVLSREGGPVGSIATQSAFAGDAGQIDVTATGNIELRDGYVISATTAGIGNAGNVSVTAGNDISITGINTGTGSSGIGSSTILPPAELEGFLAYQYRTFFPDYQSMAAALTGDPESDILTVLNGLDMSPFADFGGAPIVSGNAGNITIQAANLSVDGAHTISSSTSSDGNGGALNIQVASLSLDNGAEIRSRSGLIDPDTSELVVGTGNGGDISVIATSTVSMQNGSSISVTSLGSGLAGNIEIDVGDTLTMSDSSITSRAEGSGDGGSISVTASAVNMTENASISASSLGDGNAGNISVTGNTLDMSNSSMTSQAEGSGNGGNIGVITSSAVSMESGSSISASSLGSGTAGNISVDAGNSLDMNSSSITSQAEGDGDGGDISVAAASAVNMTDGSSISASSLGAGLAGNISIDAGRTFSMSGSSITTQAVESDGGNISLVAVDMIYLDQSEITTSVESGVGGGGNIDIDPEFVILKQSNILANAYGGPGGNINIVAGNFIATPDSVVDASSALGIDGIVNIRAPDETVSEELAVLPDNYLDVTSLMSDRCGTTAGASSLVDAGPGGRTVDPDGYLPSFAATTIHNNEEKGGNTSSGNGSHWWASYANKPGLQLAQMTCTF